MKLWTGFLLFVSLKSLCLFAAQVLKADNYQIKNFQRPGFSYLSNYFIQSLPFFSDWKKLTQWPHDPFFMISNKLDETFWPLKYADESPMTPNSDANVGF